MKVYIAAPWIHRQDAIAAGEKAKAWGLEVTSRWFTHEGDPNDPSGHSSSDEAIRQQAREDIADVMRADYVIVLNLAKSEGKAVETGIALHAGIPIVSVLPDGRRSNIFQALTVTVPTLEDALQYILPK